MCSALVNQGGSTIKRKLTKGSRWHGFIFAPILLSLSLYAPSLNYTFSEHFGYQFNDIVTALLMFVPVALIFFEFCILFSLNRLLISCSVLPLLFVLVSISALWVFNLVGDLNISENISNFDEKRPYWFLLGVICFSCIGILAAHRPNEFLRRFFKASALLSILLAASYLYLFDPASPLARIGGDSGLIIGILLSQGFAALLSLSFLGTNRMLSYYVPLPLIFAGIVLSGTRSALVASFFVFIFWLFLSLGERVNSNRPRGIGVVVVCTICGLGGGFFYIPESTFERISNFDLQGSENRWDLLAAGWGSFLNNPFGKVNGYLGVFPAEIEYSHNALHQMLLELGLVGLPLLIFVFLAGALVYFKKPVFRTHKIFILYFSVVFLVSLSAGDAYNPQLWFSLMFLAASGLMRLRKVKGADNKSQCAV